MRRRIKQGAIFTLAVVLTVVYTFPSTAAPDDSAQEIQELNKEIEERRVRLEQLEDKLDGYRSTIQQKQATANTLAAEVELIENKIATVQLDLESTNLEIDTIDTEIRVLDLEIAEEVQSIDRQHEMIIELLRNLEQQGEITPIELMFGNENFSDLFDELSRLESVHSDLKSVLDQTHASKQRLEEKRTGKESKLATLQDLENELRRQEHELEHQVGAKETILFETQNSEAQYRALVYELRQEQQYLDQQLLGLQHEIEQRLLDNDQLGDTTLLSYPVDSYILTALFHDPTYPWNHLWKHSGMDFAAPQGTPIRAAGPGYVAFARTGRSYGNYIMIVHAGGLATLYAHMSRMDVVADQFVSRGEIIGLMGGTPGTPGAGFSTGPHLHFEVRSDGIPVNPLGYLVSE